MLQWLCDKCGESMLHPDEVSTAKLGRLKGTEIVAYHLCHECAEALDSWLRHQGRLEDLPFAESA